MHDVIFDKTELNQYHLVVLQCSKHSNKDSSSQTNGAAPERKLSVLAHSNAARTAGAYCLVAAAGPNDD
jgi:hypothetical protein